MDFKKLENILENLHSARVLVIGDIMLDRFVYGHVDRISPESPVPVLAIKTEDTMLGGAGNTLSNLAGLGVKADIISLIGNDQDGKEITNKIQTLGYSAENIITCARPTTVKTRFLAGHQQLLRTDYEEKTKISNNTAQEAIKKAKSLINSHDAVILSDYGKGFLTKDLIKEIITYANEKNIPVIVDPKGKDFSIYAGATAITPNKKELHEASNIDVNSDETVTEAANHIIKTCNVNSIVATRSGEGMSVIEKNSTPVHLSEKDIEVFDVSGAGDCVIACIASAIGSGATLKEAAEIANLAGSIVVTKVGTAPIRIEELKAALKSNETEKADRLRRGEILDWNAAAEQVRRWKASGLKVGFTNGCFDILHFGHVTYLNDAKDHCDRLIMGLNKDSSISILKGPERPVHNEQSRAAVIAALGSIDTVVLFGAEKSGDDNTACALLDALKPDIYFKGGDYTIDQIPEAPTVLKNGGEVKVMPVYDGHSTTSSIAKIKAGEDKAA